MNLRVDFLQQAERRYQGPVSYGFLIVTAVVTVLAAVVLLIGYLWSQNSLLQHNLLLTRRIWQDAEPRYIQLQKAQADLGRCRKLVQELGGWNRSRANWGPLMLALQRMTPARVQLVRMEMRESLALSAAGKPAADAGQPGAEAVEPQPVRVFKINLSGQVAGEDAEQIVLDFIRELRMLTGAPEDLASVTLQSMQKDQREDTGQRIFEIELAGTERALK